MSRRKSVTFRGRTYPVIGEMTLGGKRYLLLRRLTGGDRVRYMAYDRLAGPKGDMRAICVLSRCRATRQHLDILQELSRRNPGMPAILEYHPRGDKIFVVMPWVWGEDLKRFLDRAGRGKARWPSAGIAFNLFRRLAHCLRSFHSDGNMVHGDLRPRNLILCGDHKRLVMIDFGSAWTVEKTVGREPGDGHTDPYASPEQHQDRKFVDFRSDQFSASVIAYELFTGDLPYEIGGKAGHPTFREAFADRLVPPSRCRRDSRPLPPGVWAKIDRVLATGLAIDPAARYESDELWLDDLDDIDTDLNRRPRAGLFSRILQGVITCLPASLRPKE